MINIIVYNESIGISYFMFKIHFLQTLLSLAYIYTREYVEQCIHNIYAYLLHSYIFIAKRVAVKCNTI